MSCVILEIKLKKDEHVCDLETKEYTEVVELDPATVDRDEDVYCSLSESTEVQAVVLGEKVMSSPFSADQTCASIGSYQEACHRS